MKTAAITKTKVRSESDVYLQDKVATGSLLAMGGISALIGVWSVGCIIAALLDNGPIGMLKGLFSAMTGI